MRPSCCQCETTAGIRSSVILRRRESEAKELKDRVEELDDHFKMQDEEAAAVESTRRNTLEVTKDHK